MKRGERVNSVRIFGREDIPVVANMLNRLLMPEATSGRLLAADKLPGYLEEIFFDSPLTGESTPSLVYQESGGRISGFLGVVPRKMMFQGHPIRAAVTFHFMVEPDSRSTMAGLQLLKTVFSGEYDLIFTDGAGDLGRKVWEGLGGSTAWLYSQRWIRILRPAQQAVASLSKHGLAGRHDALQYAAHALTPLTHMVDAAAMRLIPRFFPESETTLASEELEVETILEHLPGITKGLMLHPVYDEKTLRWLLNQTAKIKAYGELFRIQLRDERGGIIGWFIYYLKRGGLGTVIQMAARKNSEGKVLDHLINHAKFKGACALSGRMEPRWMQELADRGCFFNRIGCYTLIQARNPEILNALHRGDSFLTHLEGEWCLIP